MEIETDYNEKDILRFIHKFSYNNHELRTDVIKTFTEGCCYWFALVLETRFSGYIVYSEKDNHFGFYDNNIKAVFDITGNVTDKYDWRKFSEYQEIDKALYNRLHRDCIFMLT